MIKTEENKIENNNNFKEGNMNKKRISIIVMVFLAIMLIIIIGCYFYANYTVKRFDNFVYPGVLINGKELGGYTKEGLTDILTENYLNTIDKKIISIKASDKNYELNFSSLEPKYNIEKVVQEAYNYKKNETLLNKFIQITNLLNKNEKLNIALTYEYNDAAILQLADKIESEIFKEPVNASLKIENDKIIITDDVKGISLKKDELIAKLKEISTNINEEGNNVVASINENIAKTTGDTLRKINGVTATFTTSDSSNVRLINMGVAAKDLNGTIVLPGETFSFNDTVGDSLPEKGYVKSHSFINGRSVEDYGGGVCQVSTTLYGTIMRANIKPLERGPHSMPIWYVPKGLDAAVFYGVMDLKFKNEFDSPIYIYANLEGEDLTISFYGDTNAMNGVKYKPYSVQVSSWAPSGGPNYIKDSTKPKEYTKVEQSPTNGYKIDVFMQTIDDSGNVIKDEYLYSDVYNANPGFIIKGTK